MSFFVTGGVLTKWGKLTDNTDTTVFNAVKRTTIVGMRFKHNNTSGTPALTIKRDDGTTTFLFRNAEAIGAAKDTVTIDETFVLQPNDTIKAQSGDADGEFDYRITYIAGDASVGGQ